jgi:hypothetical protein
LSDTKSPVGKGVPGKPVPFGLTTGQIHCRPAAEYLTMPILKTPASYRPPVT